MEFETTIQGLNYHVTYLNRDSFLVSGNNNEYIIYKTTEWKCADDITGNLLEKIGDAIEKHLQVKS